MQASAERIQRCAQRTNDVHCFLRLIVELLHQCNRIISFYRLSEITRGGQVMIHSAIEDQKFLSTRYFYIDDPRYIDAGFAGQESTWLDHKTGSSKIGVCSHFVHQGCHLHFEATEIEFRLAGEIRDTESPAEVDGTKRSSNLRSNMAGKGNGLSVLGHEHRPIEDLRSNEHVNAAKIETVRRRQGGKQ